MCIGGSIASLTFHWVGGQRDKVKLSVRNNATGFPRHAEGYMAGVVQSKTLSGLASRLDHSKSAEVSVIRKKKKKHTRRSLFSLLSTASINTPIRYDSEEMWLTVTVEKCEK